MMGEEDLAAGRHLRPGHRLTSMQAPTVLERDGAVRLVVGSSGSNRLRSAITQVIVNVVEHGMAIDQAVAFPRVHVEGDRLDCEGGLEPDQLQQLERWGEQLVRFDGLNLYFGGANAVRRDDSGELLGGRRSPPLTASGSSLSSQGMLSGRLSGARVRAEEAT